MAEDKGAGGSAKPTSPSSAKKAPAAKKAAAKAKPTPESIGIEGTVHVGGHRLDDEQGWVPDTEALTEEED